MIFIGIFGIANRKKEYKEIKFKCTGCLSSKGTIVEIKTTFEFFFIPTFSWNRKYYLRCDECHSLYKIKEESIKKILTEKEVYYDDIEEILQEVLKCPSCGLALTEEFNYCPKCGYKLK